MVKQHLHTVLDIGSNPIVATINKNLTFKKIFVIIYMLRKYITFYFWDKVVKFYPQNFHKYMKGVDKYGLYL